MSPRSICAANSTHARRVRRRLLAAAAVASAASALGAAPAGAACTSGGLGLTAPSLLTFPTTALSGADQTVTSTLALTGDDQSGTGTGWRLTGTSTTLSTGTYGLPTGATKITAATRTAGAGNCALPANSVGYPVTLPAGSTAPTAATLVRAAAGAYSGTGAVNLSLALAIAVPGNARSGTYTSTWTLTLVSGP